ncbi:MAG: hypothetical protein STSR0008_14090 [Ignavibacterium sp.]
MDSEFKKIFIITNSDFPFGGASANFLRLFALGFSENNIEVDVILQRGRGYKDNSEFKLPDNIHLVNSLFFQRSQNPFHKIIDTIYGILRPIFYFIKNKDKPNIVFYYNYSAIVIFPSFIIFKIFRIPTCNIIVEWYEKSTLVKKYLDIWKWYDFQLRMKFLNRQFEYLLVFTRFLRNYYIDKKYNPDKIYLQPNLVDIKLFENCKELEPVDGNEFIIGYCGSPYRKDGINDLLEAFSITSKFKKNIKLKIIGDIPGKSVIPQLKQLAIQLGIINNVNFTGLLPFSEIPQQLNECDILVLARPKGIFAEAGFPTKVGEYFACKKPVVVTAVGDLPYYFKDNNEVLLAEPDNPDSVSEKLILLYDNKDLRKMIADNGYNWVKENLDYHKAVKKIILFFKGEKMVNNDLYNKIN